uniref:Uroporphyrinogen-III synthase n=1 Tax=Homalodisca liturata TaxID=320908 RepID=A0A1B6I713_9HEMI
MKNPKDIVFICKAISEETNKGNDSYCDELENRGFTTKMIPVLDFTYKNMDTLKCKLSQPDIYSGIIFTSPRCVRAVMNAIENAENLDHRWQELQTFAVGETTARLVNENLKLNPEGSCAGNGVTLAPIILSSKPSKPLLLPCGNLKMDTLETLLTEAGVKTDAVEVYETIPHPDLEITLSDALSQQTPSYIVYFSPSGIHNTYPLLSRSGIDLDKIKWVSIGPTTATALQSYNLTVHCSAAKPTPQSLAEAIISSSTQH